MRRFVVPGFTVLLLVASLASASPAFSISELPANASSAQAPDCAKAALPFMTPRADEKTDHPACGACSVAVCVGAEDGTVCGTAIGGAYKYCRPTGPLCQDGAPYADFRCTCTTTIVP